jgi:hypothetical protein
MLIALAALFLSPDLPQSVNPLCWFDVDVETCDDSTQLSQDLGPCPRDAEAIKSETGPARFVQAYWGLLACHQWQDALKFQAGNYLERNAQDLDTFIEFVTGRYDFRLQDPRSVNDDSLNGVANLVADVWWYTAPLNHADREPRSCTITFDLINYEYVGHWQIERTDSDTGLC